MRHRLPRPVLTAADHLTVARLTETCINMGTAEVIRRCEHDAVISQMRCGGEVDRDCAAYMGGLVVAEVALARRAVA